MEILLEYALGMDAARWSHIAPMQACLNGRPLCLRCNSAKTKGRRLSTDSFFLVRLFSISVSSFHCKVSSALDGS